MSDKPVMFARDIDGSGSLHPCAKGDVGSIPLYCALTAPALQVTDLEHLSIKTSLDLEINRLDVARVIDHIASEYDLVKKVKP